MEIERNLEIEKTVDGDIRLVKYVGEPGTASHRVLFEHTFSPAQAWFDLVNQVDVLEYVPPVVVTPEPEAPADPAPRAPKPAPTDVLSEDPAPRARKPSRPSRPDTRSP